MTPEDTRAVVERLVRADPTLTAAAIGRAAGVSRERARQILKEAGYVLDSVWRRPSPEQEDER